MPFVRCIFVIGITVVSHSLENCLGNIYLHDLLKSYLGYERNHVHFVHSTANTLFMGFHAILIKTGSFNQSEKMKQLVMKMFALISLLLLFLSGLSYIFRFIFATQIFINRRKSALIGLFTNFHAFFSFSGKCPCRL